jgi:hypothetical protein
MSETIAIEGRENVARFRLIALAQALAFEINTGMRMTRQALIPVAKQYGFKGNRKPAALKFIVALMQEDFGYTPSESVQKALDS